jgi:hypothetical protein
MKKYMHLGGLIFLVLITMAKADEVCGTWGYIYNHNGQKAGSELYTIHVERLDESGSAGYYYRNLDSYYNVGCGQGLSAGDWWIYAVTYESGTYYYSNGYSFWDWYPHFSLGEHDFNCTRTTPPPRPDEPKK